MDGLLVLGVVLFSKALTLVYLMMNEDMQLQISRYTAK